MPSFLPAALLTLLSTTGLFTLTLASPSASTVVVTAAPAPTSVSYADNSTFQDDILTAHNFYRAEHNASDLVWNDTSAKFAQSWSDACVFEHSGHGTGENLAAGYVNATASIDAWGLEREHYNFKKPTGFSEKTGHFTQLVWAATTSVGCGRTSCQGKDNTPGFYVVCEYYPQGNVEGEGKVFFKQNVLKQVQGKSTDTVETGVTGPACPLEALSGARVLGVAAMVVGLGSGIVW